MLSSIDPLAELAGVQEQLRGLTVLHTWGQNLHHHPHVHCVVTGGGLSCDRAGKLHDQPRWVACWPGFFLPVRVLRRVFRGKFLAGLRAAITAGTLPEPTGGAAWWWAVYGRDGVVYSKRPIGGPEQVLKYLARNTHRVAISNARLLELRDGRPNTDDAPALQVLFADGLRLEPPTVTAAMRASHPSMARARYEVAEELNQEGKLFGLAGWGEHVIKVVGFDLPMARDIVELCVAPSHYEQPLKDRARAHKSHALLWYAGREASVIEQFVALAALAGVLERFGAVAVLNELARTSFPAMAHCSRETFVPRIMSIKARLSWFS